MTWPDPPICGRRSWPTTRPPTYVQAVLAWARAYAKAGANLPALDGVPDPLVLGAGGVEGEDPFGDPHHLRRSRRLQHSRRPEQRCSASATADDGPNTSGDGSDGSDPSSCTGRRPRADTEPTPTPTPSPTPSPSPLAVADPVSLRHRRQPTPTPSPTRRRPPRPTPRRRRPPRLRRRPRPPRPTPTGPPAADLESRRARPSAVTAVPVDTNGDGVNDVLRVTVPLTAAKAGSYTVGVRLIDAHGFGSPAPSRP